MIDSAHWCSCSVAYTGCNEPSPIPSHSPSPLTLACVRMYTYRAYLALDVIVRSASSCISVYLFPQYYILQEDKRERAISLQEPTCQHLIVTLLTGMGQGILEIISKSTLFLSEMFSLSSSCILCCISPNTSSVSISLCLS